MGFLFYCCRKWDLPRALTRPARGAQKATLLPFVPLQGRTLQVPPPLKEIIPSVRWTLGIYLVPEVGLEPTRCRHQRILSPSRLPIPSFRLERLIFYHTFG